MDYLNQTVWATIGASPIHGIGVFAIRDIPKGTKITDYNCLDSQVLYSYYRVTEEELNTLLPEIKKLVLDRTYYPKSTKEFIFPSPNYQVCLTSFLNHSGNPNTDGKHAIKDIKKGEELTENYNEIYDEGLHEVSKINAGFVIL